MKALITGSQGFVGRYLREELEAHGYEVLGIDLEPGENTIYADLLDAQQTAEAVQQAEPEVVFHLAGQANVAGSWRMPQRTFEINVIGAVNLMEAVRAWNPNTRMVIVGSSDQYGNLGEAGRSVSEKLLPKPESPYAVSKDAQEKMAQIYVRAYGMKICMTRSFNHGGAGQKEGFLISDFAAGISRIEKGIASTLKVGNLSARRDFTHVRDIVCAYRLLGELGQAGEVYNVGSGTVHSAGEILEKIVSMAQCDIPIERDPMKMRPSDTPVIRCDHSKLTACTGWQPMHGVEEILRDALQDWRGKNG